LATRPIYTAHLLNTSFLSERAQCKHLQFEVKELPAFDFAAGQFVSMLAPNNGKQITRAYSIASGPNGSKRFDLCLNRVEGGFFSNYLCDLAPGADVNFHGPHGLFVLRKPLRDCVMIATGTGVAPMRSFVEWLFDDANPQHQGREIYLVYGTRHEAEIYYREYFESVASKYTNFHYVITLSRAPDEWKGHRGYVQERVREIVASRPGQGKNDMDAYICGLNLMVSENRKLLTEEFGWEKKQVIFERYD